MKAWLNWHKKINRFLYSIWLKCDGSVVYFDQRWQVEASTTACSTIASIDYKFQFAICSRALNYVYQGAASLTNCRKSRKNDVLWRDILASPKIPNAWRHLHHHFELLLITPFRHQWSLWWLVMTTHHFNCHQSSLFWNCFPSFSAFSCTKMTF